ncbi:DNA primase [Ignavigranum ruoffiae]
MVHIPQEMIEKIRSQTNIVDLIGQYVDLNKRGNNYIASCPFHEDRNPSFSVSQDKQIFKCFSCGRGGNAFSFIQEMEGVSFPEAVQKVAEFAHVPLNLDLSQDKPTQAHSHLYQIHQWVAEFYHYYLVNTKKAQPGLAYLQDRQLATETIETFQLGMAPQNSDLLINLIQEKGFSQEQALQSGIFYLDQQGQLVDRFRGRLIFPLRNQQGRVIAFSGRAFLDSQADQAKYINSPETEIFNKSRLIYNLDLARPASRKLGYHIVCEGYMDVISLYQAGFENVVATMGTSLTVNHLESLRKIASEIIFVFDGDQAGQKATARAFDLVQKLDQIQAKTIKIPNQLDPDEWIKKYGRESFQKLIDQAESFYEFQREYIKPQYQLNDDQGLAQYIEHLIQLISQIKSPVERSLRITDLSRTYQLEEAMIQEQVNRQILRQVDQTQEQSQVVGSATTVDLSPRMEEFYSKEALQSEKTILFNLIFYPRAWQFIEELDQPIVLFHPLAQELFLIVQEYYYEEGNPLPLTQVTDRVTDVRMNDLLTSILWESEKLDFNRKVMEDCLATIERAFIKQEVKELSEELNQLRLTNQKNKENQTMLRIMTLLRKIK